MTASSLSSSLWQSLSSRLQGELAVDLLHRVIYATDASVYRKLPLAVAYPKSVNDIIELIRFASENKCSLIPRATGTSLAGQCVGEGIVVDVSKHFTKILSIDRDAQTVTVQPGVIRDDLNRILIPYGLFFAPNTSTSNRSTVGGMVGNNSSGSTSIRYGVTRDKVVSMKALLSDGTEVVFGSVSPEQFKKTMQQPTLEGAIYRELYALLSKEDVRSEIKKEFPKPSIHRRNTGYAVDMLLDNSLFERSQTDINLAQLLCGSEGTLAFVTEITLQLDLLPPPHSVLVAAHFYDMESCMDAVVEVMRYPLYMCELLDKTILDCTKENREQRANRFFIEGDPKALLLMEVSAFGEQEAENQANLLVNTLKLQTRAYAYPKLYGDDITKVTELRKAGLGLLGNMIGDPKAVACIEDTAVQLSDLPSYIREFTALMDSYGQNAVYYAHAGAGELHLRPILNLKKKEDVVLFREITTQTARLVKKYGGSFSGEHGDGIVRAEFIPMMIGDKNYELLCQIKEVFDPQNIFNKGKIVRALPMDENLRYEPNRKEPEIKTFMDFDDGEGILRTAEKCNGSGDCRKPIAAGGGMCPSFRATTNEMDTTRARANALREFLTHSNNTNRFDHKELYQVFELCISCKACAAECPSNVDVAALKTEFLYQYAKSNGVPLRTRMFAYQPILSRLGSIFPSLANRMLTSSVFKKQMRLAQKRSLPKIAKHSFMKQYAKEKHPKIPKNGRSLYLYIDEFTNFHDVEIGLDAFELFTRLGYDVQIAPYQESGRSALSKGMLDYAKRKADANIAFYSRRISEQNPLVGIEPSAILSFRDEYIRLATDKTKAQILAQHTYTFEEFIQKEIELGYISSDQFTKEPRTIKVHGHCHQKSLSKMHSVYAALSLPENYTVTLIASGCCGMAGAFGYEQEHYELSMKIGEQGVFFNVRNTPSEVTIAASGTSCRHQIADGTGREALHSATILRQALL